MINKKLCFNKIPLFSNFRGILPVHCPRQNLFLIGSAIKSAMVNKQDIDASHAPQKFEHNDNTYIDLIKAEQEVYHVW